MAIKDIAQYAKEELYDICIVGSGPAGLTLCNELSTSGKKICLIESGSMGVDKKHSDLKKVVSVGEIHIKETSRERAWGGTSNTWAGLSSPLDEIDFERWPIKYRDLETYYRKLENYGFAKLEDFNIRSFDEVKKKGDTIFSFTKLQEKIFIAKDPPLSFGKQYKDLLESPHIDIFLDSTVTKINSENSKVQSLTITSSNNTHTDIQANTFVICAGGLESTRLLLVSNTGNTHDQVGKYLMNHPKNNFGILELRKPVKSIPYLFGYLESGFAKYAGLRIRENIQKELGLLNSYIRFEPMYPWTDSKGVYALITLTKRAKRVLAWWKKRQKGMVNLKDWNETGDDNDSVTTNKLGTGEALLSIVSSIVPVTLYILNRLQSKKEAPVKKIRVRNFMEMEPDIKNEITLSEEVDKYGNKIPVVNLSTTELDRKSLIELHKIFQEEVTKQNIGKFISSLEHASPWPIVFDASHHLGGTIMGTDEKTSVVDKNLKVHSTENLYVCSGSVFPTSGCANPTYTICALALRLSEHLKTV